MKFFLRILSWLKSLKPFIDTYVIPAIQTVQVLKKAVNESGTANQIETWLYKIFKNDAKVYKSLQVISEVIKQSSFSGDCLKKTTPGEIIQCFIAQVNQLPKAQKNEIWRTIAKALVTAFSQNQTTIGSSSIDTAIQLAYTFIKDKKS